MGIKLGWKSVVGVIGVVVTVLIVGMTAGMNDAGYRTVIQFPNGSMNVKFTPGIYFKVFGKSTVYNDVITMDADADEASSGATIDQPGVAVRYRDGGSGTIYGKAQFNLPNDEVTMLSLHKVYRSNSGVAYKLIKSVAEEAINQTAGLMTSEEGYDAKRSIFTQMAKSQISKGLYKTESDYEIVTDEVTGKTIRKQYAKISTKDGMEQHITSDLEPFGITLTGFRLNNPTFEQKTMDQISEKRKATMAIITSKANAEKAKQDAITAEEKGKANVMTAKYAKEVEKQEAVTDAEKKAEVARIAAEQKVTVAQQSVLEATAYKDKQAQLKEANILEGEGLAEKKRLVMEADGALEQKLAAVIEINKNYATEFGKQKWVSEINMGGVSGDSGNAASEMIQLLTIQAAKAVNADLAIK